MTKYVIIMHNKKDTLLPVIPGDNNRRIEDMQNRGYKIIGRFKIDDDFTPVHAVIIEKR